MNSVGALLGPDGDPAIHVALVTSQYVELPGTPLPANPQDQRQARRCFEAGVRSPLSKRRFSWRLLAASTGLTTPPVLSARSPTSGLSSTNSRQRILHPASLRPPGPLGSCSFSAFSRDR